MKNNLANTNLNLAFFSRVLMAGVILISAFLLFQVQPLMAKFILPWFGGAAAVWTICMLFYQVSLLMGYCYVHFSVSYLKKRNQAILHGILLIIAFYFLPLRPDELQTSEISSNPVRGVLYVLTLSIGIPFFVISATSSLIQSWHSRIVPNSSPYPLYALSNLGSMVALLSYPFLIETNFKLIDQTTYWSLGYDIFILLFLILTIYFAMVTWGDSHKSVDVKVDKNKEKDKPILWCLLAATASILLLSISDHLSRDVAAIPFLWVIPLSLYLLSFILCFESDRWYRRQIFIPMVFILVAISSLEMVDIIDIQFFAQITLYCGLLFAVCMVCHGELVGLRPPSKRLARFYLVIAAGGAIGGIFVGLVAPMIFVIPLELHFGIALMLLLIGVILFNDPLSKFHKGQGRITWMGMAIFLGLFIYGI